MTVSVPYASAPATGRIQRSPGTPFKTYACCLIGELGLTVAKVVFSTRTVGEACDHAVDLVKNSPEAARGFDLWFCGQRIVSLRPGGPAACLIKITDDIDVAVL